MSNDFLANVEQEGRVDLDELVRSNEEERKLPPESPAEKKQEDESASPAGEPGTDETTAPEKGEPKVFHAFHEHPAWLASQDELKQLREFREKATPLLDDFASIRDTEAERKTKEIPAWFIDVFGENHEAWKKYQDYNVAEKKQLREEILRDIREQSQKKEENLKKWDKWIDDEVVSLTTNEEIQARAKAIGFDLSNEDQSKSFQNELLKVATEFQPSEDDRTISIKKSFEILELLKLKKASEKKPNERRKEIAAETMQKGKSENQPKGYRTSHDLAGKSFRDLIPE